MKKIRMKAGALLLTCMMLGALAGCGGDASSADASAADTSSADTDTASAEGSFEAVTLLDTDECTAVVTGAVLDTEDEWGDAVAVQLSVEASNHTTDTELTLGIDAETVNNVVSYSYDEVTLAAAESGTYTFDFYVETPEDIGEITDLLVFAELWETETTAEDDLESVDFIEELAETDSIHIYPSGAENAAAFARVSQDTDVVLAEDPVKITYIGAQEYYGYEFIFYLENVSGQDLYLDSTLITVNGAETEVWDYASFSDGQCAYLELWFDEYDMEDLGLTDISEIETAEVMIVIEDDDFEELSSEVYTVEVN